MSLFLVLAHNLSSWMILDVGDYNSPTFAIVWDLPVQHDDDS